MRAIASSMQRVIGGAFLAVLVTLVGCGGTSLRRPLVTDETPLGTPESEVRAWYAKNGWCARTKPARWGDKVLLYQPCAGPDRARIATVLRFKDDGSLYAAWVYAKVPRDEAPASGPPYDPHRSGIPAKPIGVRYEPGSSADREIEPLVHRRPLNSYGSGDRRDLAIELLEALAFEIEARHGDGDQRSPGLRSWKTRREWILLYVQRGWVVEAHWPSVCDVCLP